VTILVVQFGSHDICYTCLLLFGWDLIKGNGIGDALEHTLVVTADVNGGNLLVGNRDSANVVA